MTVDMVDAAALLLLDDADEARKLRDDVFFFTALPAPPFRLFLETSVERRSPSVSRVSVSVARLIDGDGASSSVPAALLIAPVFDFL
jgi:hypothetical protein